MTKLSLLLAFCFSTIGYAAPPTAMFSPYEGKEAFEKMYQYVEQAQSTAHITIYSWSDSGITKAMEKLLTDNPKVKLRVVLHRPLARKESTLAKVAELEKLGAMFKMAKMNMHEKFVLVDSDKLMNSSANMSGGAKYNYSEDFVFIDSDGEAENDKILADFEKEFSILWNTSDDIVTTDELQKADSLKYDTEVVNTPANSDMTLVSSSMNFTLKKNKPTSADYKSGRMLDMILKKGLDENSYEVAKNIINAVDNAKKSIDMSVNHFNLYSVSKALIRAVKRGVKVRLFVDNQEFKTNIRDSGRQSIEMSPRFVRDFKKLAGNSNKEAPVRVKFYSHAPHHSYWFLNHHKYILIDYDENQLADTVLLAGSYNISKNAELKQFDSLVFYKTKDYKDLYKSYAKNFEMNWMFNRNKSDRPEKDILAKYTQISNGNSVAIHSRSAEDVISLTWSEAIKLKEDIGKVAPGFYRSLYQNRGCTGFNFVKQVYFGGSCKK